MSDELSLMSGEELYKRAEIECPEILPVLASLLLKGTTIEDIAKYNHLKNIELVCSLAEYLLTHKLICVWMAEE